MAPDKFDRYSWFWNDEEDWGDSAFLFIKDDDYHYYLGTDEKPLVPTFRKIIEQHLDISGLDSKSAYSVGGSMGGYAAIFYASLMGFGGAITVNPQIAYKCARQHSYDNWERRIRETGFQFYDLDDYIKKRPVPNIYIEYGMYPADEMAAEMLIQAVYSVNGRIIINKKNWATHTVDGLHKNTILNTIMYFENENMSEE